MRIRLKHDRLAAELAKSPLTLNRWAQKMGLRSGHLSELANGKRLHPTAKTREKLLQGLDLEFEDLFEFAETPAAPKPITAPPPAFSNRGAAPAVIRTHRGSAMNNRFPATIFSGLGHDLRSTLRSLRSDPSFCLTSLLILTLGLGTTIALFTVVYSALFRAYPFPDQGQLAVLQTVDEARGGARSAISFPNFLDFADQAAEDIELAAWDWEPFSLAGGERAIRAPGIQTTANFQQVLGLPMVKGRWFTEAERAGEERLVVLRESLWRSNFGSDPAIVGRQVELNGQPTTVLGIAPDSLNVDQQSLLWVPLRTAKTVRARRSNWLRVIGRLSDGTTMAGARASLTTIADALEAAYPDANDQRSISLSSLREERVGEIRNAFLSTLAVVTLLLILIAANVSSLYFARTVARESEFAVRHALGATRFKVLRHLLLEVTVLGAAGWFLGLGLARLLTGALLRFAPESSRPPWLDTSLDGSVLAFSVVVAAAVTALTAVFAVGRALAASSPARQRQGAGGNQGASRLRGALVVSQIVLATVLALAAALSARSLRDLHHVDPGFETEQTLLVGLDLLSLRGQPERLQQAFARYEDALGAIPGVEAAGATDQVPFASRSNHGGVTVENRAPGDYNARAQVIRATPNYPAALGLPLLEGSSFSDGENQDPDVRHALVSQSLASRWWPERSSLGERFKMGLPEDDRPWFTVIGVVGDVHQFGLDRDTSPTIYITQGSDLMSRAYWVLSSKSRGPTDLAVDVRTVVETIDASQPVHGIVPMREHVGASLWIQRFLATVFSALSVIALILAAVGLAGVISYTVSLRRQEIGVRVAMGASPEAIRRMFARGGMRLMAAGVGIGLPLSLLAGRLMAAALPGVRPFDPAALIFVVGTLLAVGWISTLLPARRAARLDPVEVLSRD